LVTELLSVDDIREELNIIFWIFLLFGSTRFAIMKAAILSAAAAMVAGVSARSHGHRHAHRMLEDRSLSDETCGCTTVYSTIYGTDFTSMCLA
jgi:hypothetical protein